MLVRIIRSYLRPYRGLVVALVALQLVRISHSELQGAPNASHIFTARLSGEPRVDGRELVEAQWFDVGELPRDMVRIARRQIDNVLGMTD